MEVVVRLSIQSRTLIYIIPYAALAENHNGTKLAKEHNI